MDFEFDEQQEALLEAVGVLLSRYAGTERARTVLADERYDRPLERALADAGFLDLVTTDGAGPLEAALVVEAVSAAHGTIAAGTRALVLPALGIVATPGPVALADTAAPGPIRFANVAETVLVIDDERVLAVAAHEHVTTADSPYSFPFGRLTVVADELARLGEPIDVDPGRLRDWWRLSIAAEIAGLLAAGLALTTRYVSDRHQFGRPLASFQAVQHQLAESHVSVEATRWLVRWAAYHDAEREAALAAATYAASAVRSVVAALHQVSGAMGFTEEHDLALGTLRAVALRVELGGIPSHAAALARTRWPR